MMKRKKSVKLKIPKTKVQSYSRKASNGKVYKVKGYSRRRRPQGKKVVKYKRVGTLFIGHDKFGNIKKSKVIRPKRTRVAKPAPVKRKRRLIPTRKQKASIEEQILVLDRKFFKDQSIKYKPWIQKRLELSRI